MQLARELRKHEFHMSDYCRLYRSDDLRSVSLWYIRMIETELAQARLPRAGHPSARKPGMTRHRNEGRVNLNHRIRSLRKTLENVRTAREHHLDDMLASTRSELADLQRELSEWPGIS